MNELGSGRTRCGCDPAEGVFFWLSVDRGRPAVRRHVGRTRTPRGKSFRSCAVSEGLRRGACSCAGQILSLVRRVGRPSPRGVFLRGKSFRLRAVSGGLRRGACSCAGQILSLVRRVGMPSPRRAFSRGQILLLVRRVGRLSPWGVFLRGQIPSLVRRVGRPSPRGVFSRGANLFARAPCREAFVEESLLARGKSFRSCAVSGGFRRGACS